MGYTPEILVLGGGITGTAIARDLAIRGLEVTLVERDTLTSGATSRMQGLLYSGARYAETDERIARNCYTETQTLTEIADHCIEETSGLLVRTDDEAFESLVSACEECKIPVQEHDGDAARSMVERLSETVEHALEVPDAVVDPFRLTLTTARSALEHGAEIRTKTEVTDIHTEDGAIETVTVEHDPEPTGRSEDEMRPDGGRETGGPGGPARVPGMPGAVDESPGQLNASAEELQPDYVVNATGAWADQIAELAGFEMPLKRTRSAMAVTGDRPVEMPVSLYGDGPPETVVPYGTHCVLGSTALPAGEGSFSGDPDQTAGESDEIERLFDELSTVVADLEDTRLLRSFWGVRSGPPGAGIEGRQFGLVDHADRDDCWGMVTVVGGTLTTHRLVAERTADHVCREFGISRECKTDEMGLPGSEDEEFLNALADQFDLPTHVTEQTSNRLGNRALELLDTDGPNPVLCETQGVTRAEIQDALSDDHGTKIDLNELRIQTTATMGSCQGGRCAHRIATELFPEYDARTIEDALDDLLEERWKGQRLALWGRQLTQAARNYRFHAETLGRKYRTDEEIDIAAFDDGSTAGGNEPPTARRGGLRR